MMRSKAWVHCSPDINHRDWTLTSRSGAVMGIE